MTDQRERMADALDAEANARDSIADDRERIADERDRLAALRGVGQVARAEHQQVAAVRTQIDQEAADSSVDAARGLRRAARSARTAAAAAAADLDDRDWVDRGWAAERREFVADDRQQHADVREVLADERESHADERDELLSESVNPVRTTVGVAEHVTAPVGDGEAGRGEAAVARQAAALARRISDRDRAAVGSAHPLAAEFVQMTRSLLRAETVELAMTDVVDAAVRFVNGCDAASFSAYVDDVITTLASTGPVADEADAAQYQVRDGPCLQAIRTLQLVIAVDLGQDDRWPTFVAAAPKVRSVISTPVVDERSAGGPFGSLNSYGMKANAFDGEDADTALLLTAHLGVLLHLATVTSKLNQRLDQLADAVASRDVIGQAKGILMERERLTAAEAFDVLRTTSQRLNLKLRDVAEQLTTSGEIPAADPSEPRRDRSRRTGQADRRQPHPRRLP